MNLAADKWIPVVRLDDQHDEVSLTTAFTEGDRIADLAVRPPERIALMRLLLCAAHAALDPTGKDPRPRDQDDWYDCRDELATKSGAYMQRWASAFELLDGDARFLQVQKLVPAVARQGGKNRKSDSGGAEEAEGKFVDKLDIFLAAGTNTTLFDNAGGSERSFTMPRLAMMLLTFQSFSVSGPLGLALWNGVETLGKSPKNPTKTYTSHAVCASGNALHTFIRQPTLIESIHANLINYDHFAQHAGSSGSWGRPVWEAMPVNPASVPALTRNYLGRLVPLCRAVHLDDKGRTMVLANGLDYPAFDEIFPEPSTTIVVVKDKGERKPLSAQVDKALWRQLGAVTVLWRGGNVGGPLALRNVLDIDAFDLWVGGLIARGNAKIVDSVESVFRHVPVELTTDTGQQRYNEGVEVARRIEFRLGRGVAKYRRLLKDEIERGEGRKRGLKLKAKAAVHYWTAVENQVPKLLALVRDFRPEFQKAWNGALLAAALDAYDIACPHETPRRMKAHVLGRTILLRLDSEPTDENETQEETE
jgi:CRISPR system Cascade subunit CasA